MAHVISPDDMSKIMTKEKACLKDCKKRTSFQDMNWLAKNPKQW